MGNKLISVQTDCTPTIWGLDGFGHFTISKSLQGYLAHQKPPPPLGSPLGPRHRPTVGSYGGGGFL